VTTLRQKVSSGGAAELVVLDEIGVDVGVTDDGVGVMKESLVVDDAATEDDAEFDVEESLLDTDKDDAIGVEEDDVVSKLLLLVVLTTCVDDDTVDEIDELLVEATLELELSEEAVTKTVLLLEGSDSDDEADTNV
jgi:hypothetical protein